LSEEKCSVDVIQICLGRQRTQGEDTVREHRLYSSAGGRNEEAGAAVDKVVVSQGIGGNEHDSNS
jgi:hypothetical protein